MYAYFYWHTGIINEIVHGIMQLPGAVHRLLTKTDALGHPFKNIC